MTLYSAPLCGSGLLVILAITLSTYGQLFN
jgi:hypothetical protein